MTPTTAQVTLSLNAAQYFAGMGKVQAEAKTAAAGIASSFTAARSVLAGFTGVVGAVGLGGILSSTAAYAKEVDRLSTLSNQGAREFQGYAYAAKTVGIEQEKLADIFKDVQDKVGDFVQNGGGPLKDFFDNIAPRVGVTAEQFRNLGGKDSLQLYVDSLEKANLSQSEMTFYMEAIASDSTLLLPLLRDNGKAMSDLADEAERVGRVLDDGAIRAGKEFEQNLNRLQGAAEGLKLKIGNDLIPWVTKLSNEFLTGIRVAGGFWAALRTFGTISPESNAAEGAKKYREELSKLTAARERLVNAEGVMANTVGFDRDIDLARTRLSYFNDLQRQGMEFSADSQSTAEARRLGLVSAPVALPPVTPAASRTGRTGGGAARAQDPDAEAKRYLDNLQKQLQATRDLSVEETLLADAQAGRLGKVNADRLEELRLVARQIDDARIFADIDKDMAAAKLDTARATARANEEQERMLQNMLDASPTAQLEKQRAEMQLLANAYERGRINAEEFSEAATARLGNVAEKQKEANEDARQFGQITTSVFEDAIFKGEDLGDVLKGLFVDMGKLLIRQQILEPLAGVASNFFGGIFGGFRAAGGPTEAGKSYVVGENGPEVWTAGVSGFVTPNHALATSSGGAGGGVVINQYNTIDARGADAGVDQKIRTAMRQAKEEAVAAVQARANRGGAFAASMGRA
jgi:hypothetical protein